MLAAIELLRVHRGTIEKLQPDHPELSKIDALIAHGEELIAGHVNEVVTKLPPPELPPLEDPYDIDLAERYKNIFGKLGDDIDSETAMVYFNTKRGTFAQLERTLIRLGLNRGKLALRRMGIVDYPNVDVAVLGDIRRVLPEAMVASKMISYRRALIFLHGIQKTPSDT